MYIDLTHTFTKDMPVFPGDAAPKLLEVASVKKDGFLDHVVETSMHVGTHMDAPAHMVEGGKYLSDYSAEKFFGRGVIIDARGKKSAGPELLSGIDIKKNDIVLVCFGWSTEFGKDEYYQNYPEISEALATELGKMGISILGIDTSSPDRAPYKTHKILFEKDILIIENLTNLESLFHYQSFEIIALPVKLKTDSAPVRVVAKL
jgi:kynurenine formamidase